MDLTVPILCLSLVAFNEAGNKGFEEMKGVIATVVNRSELSGRSLCEEVYLDNQYHTPTINLEHLNELDLMAYDKARLMSSKILNGYPIPKVTHFYKVGTKRPNWAREKAKVYTDGTHNFYYLEDYK